MTAEIRKLRPKRHGMVVERIQGVLDLHNLSDQTRDELASVLERYEPASPWGFTMLSQQQLRAVLKLINATDKPAVTLRVWTALTTYVRMDTGEIMAGRLQLAADAETTAQEVSRAFTRLADIGALIRIRPGRYAINPHVGWAGSLDRREAAASKIAPLQLVK
jgi:hypothetical protein